MSETEATTQADSDTAPLVVIDLGEHKHKHVKRLRKGKGKLMDDVQDVIEELRGSGTIAADAQPVVIVVRDKRESMLSFLR